MLQLINLNKDFAGKPLLTGVSWHLKKGERVGLVGENGAGKSTLLRVLSGFMTPTHGTVQVLGHRQAGKDLARLRHEGQGGEGGGRVAQPVQRFGGHAGSGAGQRAGASRIVHCTSASSAGLPALALGWLSRATST